MLCSDFRRDMNRDFFQDARRGPQTQPRKDAVRDRIIALRKRNLSVYDIHDALEQSGNHTLSVTAIQEVLRDAGFARLPRRADDERPERPRPARSSDRAMVRSSALVSLSFIPLLAITTHRRAATQRASETTDALRQPAPPVA